MILLCLIILPSVTEEDKLQEGTGIILEKVPGESFTCSVYLKCHEGAVAQSL